MEGKDSLSLEVPGRMLPLGCFPRVREQGTAGVTRCQPRQEKEKQKLGPEFHGQTLFSVFHVSYNSQDLTGCKMHCTTTSCPGTDIIPHHTGD